MRPEGRIEVCQVGKERKAVLGSENLSEEAQGGRSWRPGLIKPEQERHKTGVSLFCFLQR